MFRQGFQVVSRQPRRFCLLGSAFLLFCLLMGLKYCSGPEIFKAKDNCSPEIPTVLPMVELNHTEQPLDAKIVEENFRNLNQLDLHLIQYTRLKYLSVPSTLPYDFTGYSDPENSSSVQYADNFSEWMATFFKNTTKPQGIFVEVGDGARENTSHTLMLELRLNWTGLVVECNPEHVPDLLKLHRKVWIANACPSTSTTPGKYNLKPKPCGQEINLTLWQPHDKSNQLFEVTSIPLYSLLAAARFPEINYFALNVGGREGLQILQTVPENSLKILVLTVAECLDYKWVKQLESTLEKHELYFGGHIDDRRLYVHSSLFTRYIEMRNVTMKGFVRFGRD